MIKISVCMIMKNEEKNLARCLDSLREIADEWILVDTGSTDRTCEIAASYTDHIHTFCWNHDFAAARNYASSLATMDYIYSADADEFLSIENQEQFLQLKQVLLPEIDIVQMLYSNQLSYNTVYNYDCEYRPKLFKRIRPFLFRDPIHEILTTDPVIFDSDIVITHMPDSCHACRDFQSMVQIEASKHPLSNRLLSMYARELFIAGADSDFLNAQAAFLRAIALPDVGTDLLLEATCVLAKCALIQKNEQSFFRYALKNIALKGCSEMCYLIGNYYETIDDKKEALIWYQNAATETDCILNLSYQEKYAPEKISTIQSSV